MATEFSWLPKRKAMLHLGPVTVDSKGYQELLEFEESEGGDLSEATVAALQVLPNFQEIKEQLEYGHYHTAWERVAETAPGKALLESIQYYREIQDANVDSSSSSYKIYHYLASNKNVPAEKLLSLSSISYLQPNTCKLLLERILELTPRFRNLTTDQPTLSHRHLMQALRNIATNEEGELGGEAAVELRAITPKKPKVAPPAKVVDINSIPVEDLAPSQLPKAVQTQNAVRLLQLSVHPAIGRVLPAFTKNVNVPVQGVVNAFQVALQEENVPTTSIVQALSLHSENVPSEVLELVASSPAHASAIVYSPQVTPELMQQAWENIKPNINKTDLIAPFVFSPKTPKNIQEEALSLFPGLLSSVGSNFFKNLNPDLYPLLLEADTTNLPDDIIAVLFRNRNTSLDEINKFLSGDKVKVYGSGDMSDTFQAIINRRDLTPDLVRKLWEKFPSNDNTVSIISKADESLLNDIFTADKSNLSQSSPIRAMAALQPIPKSILGKLLGIADAGVRELLAKNDSLHPTTLRGILARDPSDTRIVSALLTNANLDPSIIRLLYNHYKSNSKMLESIAENPSTPDVLIQQLAKENPTDEIRLSLARNKNTPDAIIDTLLKDSKPKVVLAAAASGKISPEKVREYLGEQLVLKDEMKDKGFFRKGFDHIANRMETTNLSVPMYVASVGSNGSATLTSGGANIPKWGVYIDAYDQGNELPSELFHNQNLHKVPTINGKYLGWVGGTWDEEKKRLFMTELQSDVLQRTKELASKPHLVKFKKFKSKIENRFDGWAYVFFNQALREAYRRNAKEIWVPTSKTYLSFNSGVGGMASMYDKVCEAYPSTMSFDGGWHVIPIPNDIKVAHKKKHTMPNRKGTRNSYMPQEVDAWVHHTEIFINQHASAPIDGWEPSSEKVELFNQMKEQSLVHLNMDTATFTKFWSEVHDRLVAKGLLLGTETSEQGIDDDSEELGFALGEHGGGVAMAEPGEKPDNSKSQRVQGPPASEMVPGKQMQEVDINSLTEITPDYIMDEYEKVKKLPSGRKKDQGMARLRELTKKLGSRVSMAQKIALDLRLK